MSRYNLAWLLAVPLLVIFGLTLSTTAANRDREKDYKTIRTLVDVLAEVDQRYVRELDDKARQKLIEDMINGGLEKLDPHSAFMNADEFKQFNTQTQGSFAGIGIQMGVDPKTGLLMVNSPMVGTPAYDAGILAGDIIIKIDGQPTDGLTLPEAIKKVQGELGTKIIMTVVHEGAKEPVDIEITRAKIDVPSVLGYTRKPENLKEFDYFADREAGIAYIRIIQFVDHTTEDLKKAIEKVKAEGAKSLILDLRDNPGGLLKSAVEISDLFLDEGTIVSTKNRHGVGKTETASPGDAFKDKKIAILINRQSASASEIVSSALQDNKRAVLIGERSFGKGSVQQIIKLNSDPPTALRLTTDSYWRPSGANIHRHLDSKETDEWGVKPDAGYEIEMKDQERLEYLKYRRNRDIVRKDKNKDETPFVDRAMEKALEHLKK